MLKGSVLTLIVGFLECSAVDRMMVLVYGLVHEFIHLVAKQLFYSEVGNLDIIVLMEKI